MGVFIYVQSDIEAGGTCLAVTRVSHVPMDKYFSLIEESPWLVVKKRERKSNLNLPTKMGPNFVGFGLGCRRLEMVGGPR